MAMMFLDRPEHPILAWHYVPPDGYIRYSHGGIKVKAEVGLVLIRRGPLTMCEVGLHASLDPLDAAKYCTGILCRVACSGEIIFGADKLVCERREILAMYEDGKPPW